MTTKTIIHTSAEAIDSLIVKYRPQTLKEVIGQDAVVNSLRNVLVKGTSRCFLFTGPSGVGKTSLGRLIAKHYGAGDNFTLHEIDAATHTGIDDMRNVITDLEYRPFGDVAIKCVIVDEVHGLSKQAVDSLLKALEEPPSWVVWVLCTTEPTKVRKAVLTRCTRYDLRPVATPALLSWINTIAQAEGMKLHQDFYLLCAESAEGSPRLALANLAIVDGAKDFQDARQLLRNQVVAAEAIDLARLLVQGAGWDQVLTVLNKMKEADPESIRHTVRAYMTTVVLGSKSNTQSQRGLAVLEAFGKPFYPPDGISPVVLACGELILGG